MLETELYEPVKSFFESQGYIVKAEINDIDILALKDDLSIAIELKVKISLKHIYQAIERQKLVDNVFLAIPKATYKSHKDSIRHFHLLLKRLSLGLIIVDGDKVEVLFEPNYYDLDKSKSLNKRRKNKLLEDFNSMKKDANTGGSTGVMVASGSSNLNNLVIFNTVIAVTNNAFGYKTDTMPTYITMDYVKVYNSWANSLYAHGGQGFLIYNSEILQSGGAAIHMVDTKPAIFDESYNKIGDPNPYLYLDSTTIINNWISGEEAWFKAYGMSQVALTLKSGIETGISGAERSIINLMTDPITGLETEKINFILLTEPSAGAKVMLPPNNVTQISGSEFKIHIGDYTVERPFDYLTSGDPRISNNQFAFPLGDYSEYSAFQALIVELMTTYGMDAGNAQNLAQLAAFYGLTAGEVVSAYTYAQMNAVSFRTAVLTTMPTHELPEYMEVLAPVPVFTSGYSIVIIQFSE